MAFELFCILLVVLLQSKTGFVTYAFRILISNKMLKEWGFVTFFGKVPLSPWCTFICKYL